MKTKLTLLLALFLGANMAIAQDECMTKMSIMAEYAKAKNFKDAYGPYKELLNTCPKYNKAIYKYGEDILEDKIKNAAGGEKVAFISELIKMWEVRKANFASKTPKGKYETKAALLQYDNKAILKKTDEQLYAAFDAAFTGDRKNFKDPKGLYVYFKLMVSLFDDKKKSAQELFDKYDDVAEKIEEEVAVNSEKLNVLLDKEEAGKALSSKEKKYKKYHSQVLKALDKIAGSLDTELGERANCSNLIPLYQKDFESKKGDAAWLQRAAGKMSAKDCTDDPLFFKLVDAYHKLSPSANSAYYLGILKDKEGKSSSALKFYEQALRLETDNFKKAKLNEKIGNKLKKKGQYATARKYYQAALRLNRSRGAGHLKIAAMYASSANKCGTDSFNKRAVFWLAASEARKAGQKDPTLKNHAAKVEANYKAKAPQKADIFSKGNAGKVIKIGCWIGSSVTVPKL